MFFSSDLDVLILKIYLSVLSEQVNLFLWQTGFAVILLLVAGLIAIYTFYKCKIHMKVFIIVAIFSYHAYQVKYYESRNENLDWEETIGFLNGFHIITDSHYNFGTAASVFEDFIFHTYCYTLSLPLNYILGVVNAWTWNFQTNQFHWQDIVVPSNELMEKNFMAAANIRAATFNEADGVWHFGLRETQTSIGYSNMPPLNATLSPEGKLLSFHDRNGNVVTEECASWDYAKVLYLSSMFYDVAHHWHIPVHFQYSYVYSTMNALPKKHSLRAIMNVHQRLHSVIDHKATRNVPLQDLSSRLVDDHNPVFLGDNRFDADQAYFWGTPIDGTFQAENMIHAAEEHASKTFPPEYALENNAQSKTPYGAYIKDQYSCVFDFVANVSESEGWYYDDDVTAFLNVSAKYDADLEPILDDEEKLNHYLASIIFESSILHSFDHYVMNQAFGDISAWNWHIQFDGDLKLPECNATDDFRALRRKSWLDYVRAYSFTKTFLPFVPWNNYVLSDQDFLMKMKYSDDDLHQSKTSDMKSCLLENQSKHQEVVAAYELDLDFVSSSIQF